MKIKLFYLLVVIQIIIVVFVAYKIYKNYKKEVADISLAPLQKENLAFIQSAELKNFYEPKPSSEYRNINPRVPEAGINTINDDSLNERYNYAREKRDDVYRIISLGDSYTFGMYVDTDKNWSEQLEDILNKNKICKKYNKYEVINLGMEGYDVQYSIERFKIRGSKYNPDLVLFLLKKDDYEQINEIMLEKKKEYDISLKESGEYDTLLQQGINYPSWQKAMDDTYKELGEEKIKKLVITYFDEFNSVYKNPLVILNFSHESKATKSFSQKISKKYKNSRAYTELISIYNERKNYFENDTHPTADGHKVMAEDIYGYLKKNKIINCQ